VLQRLSKYLSASGVASRRKADAMIKSGDVKVNNIVVVDPWHQVDSKKDAVTIDNNKITIVNRKLYIALNKPKGYLSDLSPGDGRKLARELIRVKERIYPVGRLDFNSEGLLLFSNDGDFVNRATHPRYGNNREYLVKFQGVLRDEDLVKAREGILENGDLLTVRSMDVVGRTKANTWCRMVLGEGRYREIRRIGEVLGHAVLKLRRVRVGPVMLGALKPGQYRHLETWEIGAMLGSGKEKTR
jgi:23S rRNA pseudouridine2605 synthase